MTRQAPHARRWAGEKKTTYIKGETQAKWIN